MIGARCERPRRSGRIGVAVLLVALLLPVVTAVRVGATATVSNCGDSGSGSLRAALGAGGTITFTTDCPATGPIRLTSGSLQMSGTQTVDGTGHMIVVDGNGQFTVFTILAGATASLNNLTIQHGNGSVGCLPSTLCGGGIVNVGSLTLTNTIVTASQAKVGGGIYNSDQALALTLTNSIVSANTASSSGGGLLDNGQATLNGSTVSGNSANLGGGIYALSTEHITNSTISGNHAVGGNGNGGGIYCPACDEIITGSTISGNMADNLAAGIFLVDAGMTMTNSTVSGNTAAVEAGGIEALQEANQATFTLIQSTVSGNSAPTGNGISIHTSSLPTIKNSIIDNNCTSSASTAGYNIDRFGTCGLTGTGDRSGDPGIGLLANNGGPTKTHLPLAGSQAIDKIPNTSGCNGAGITTDQRGFTRPQPAGGLCDIGAVEIVPPPTITNLYPSSGSTTGGMICVIFGTGFLTGATVTFDGLTASIIAMNSVAIRVTTPPHPTPATVNVVVTNPDGGSFTLPNSYAYGTVNPLPPPQPTAPTTGGTPLPLPPTRSPAPTAVTIPLPLPPRRP